MKLISPLFSEFIPYKLHVRATCDIIIIIVWYMGNGDDNTSIKRRFEGPLDITEIFRPSVSFVFC